VKYGQIWRITEKEHLLYWAQDNSSFLKIELNRIERDKELLTNIRGYGTHIGFDLNNETVCDSLQRWLWKCGINVHKVGPRQLGLRPPLTVTIPELALLREALMHYHPNHEK
jgi:4-aminobutyrate aminotransferase-like enzyme